MKRKIKYGMIGVGLMGRAHLGCINEVKDIEIVAAADINRESLEEFMRQNPNKKTEYFSDYRDLLRLDNIDAVVIATPDNTHVDITIESLAANKHVLCEKPAATTFRDFERLEEAVKKSDKIYQTGLECRYLPVYQRMKKMIDDGMLGNPKMIWCKEFRGPFLKRGDNWIMFQDKTGGVFVEKTCHYFDLMTWFSCSLPKRVIAVASTEVVKDISGVKPDIFDNGWVIIEYKNGIKGMLGLCMFCKCDTPLEMGVIGDKGKMEGFMQKSKIEYSEFDTLTTITVDAKGRADVEHLSHGGGVYYEHLAFIDNIRNNITPLTDIEVAKWSVYVGLAAEESARKEGEAVVF